MEHFATTKLSICAMCGSDTGCHAHWLPFFSVEGCFGARKQDMKIFLSFHQAKTGQLDKQ
jgi:hypothetical protein